MYLVSNYCRTISGYFVGIGLLLTFIGLVIALSAAAGSTSTGDAKNMTASLFNLLNAATFKFSASIAGLFSSIALSILFRILFDQHQSGFDNLCRQVENRVFYLSPQFITYRAYGVEQEQLHHLKEINDVQFFQRFGQAVGPALKSAVEKCDRAVGHETGQYRLRNWTTRIKSVWRDWLIVSRKACKEQQAKNFANLQTFSEK